MSRLAIPKTQNLLTQSQAFGGAPWTYVFIYKYHCAILKAKRGFYS